MSVSADEIAAHSDKDHGVRDVDALLVVAHEAAPSCHPAEGALDNPAAGRTSDFEALLVVGSADDLYHEVQIDGLVHELQPVIGAVGEQMLHPGPTFADAVQDRLSPGAVGDIGRRQVDHQQPPIRIDGDVALAADNLFRRRTLLFRLAEP